MASRELTIDELSVVLDKLDIKELTLFSKSEFPKAQHELICKKLEKRMQELFGNLKSDYDRITNNGVKIDIDFGEEDAIPKPVLRERYHKLIDDLMSKAVYTDELWHSEDFNRSTDPELNIDVYRGNYEYALLSAFKHECKQGHFMTLEDALYDSTRVLNRFKYNLVEYR